jgi:GTP-binding protein Era
MSDSAPNFRSGHVAVVGRPNVGKSTLVNAWVGEALCSVAPRPQTTRHRILGVVHREHAQVALIDTPGLHDDAGGRALNRLANRAARGAIGDADVIVLLVEAGRWNSADSLALSAAVAAKRPIVLAINKIDQLKSKPELLPFLAICAKQHAFAAMVPIAAGKNEGIAELEKAVIAELPEAAPHYDADTLTDRSLRFFAAEAIREQVIRQLSDELPYAAAVDLEAFEEAGDECRITAAILVEREGQKGIVIGKGGAMIKSIGMRARQAIEHRFGVRAHLDLTVRVRQGWADNDAALSKLGYSE